MISPSNAIQWPASWSVSDLESIIYDLLLLPLHWRVGTLLYTRRCCAKQFSSRKSHSRPHTWNQLWLMLGSVTACNVLQRQAFRGRPGSMANNTMRQYVLLSRLCPGDKRTQGFMDDILTFDNINTLLLMDYVVLLHTHSVRCLKMKCYPL